MTPARCLFAVPLLIASAGSIAASPLALSCQGCHQPAVDSTQMPSLRKQPAQQIADYLRRSRDTPQVGSIMARFTSKLSDADIDRLATELGKKSK
jgi:cytochrome c553